MMYSYPLFPHFYSRPYSRYPSSFRRTNQNTEIKKDERYASKERKAETDKEEEVLFEILGIKLHSDDILLLCLIFFLYNEGVKDEFLFIALILLLLS